MQMKGYTQKAYISIVIPAYNESGNIQYLYKELFNIMTKINEEWEIILVDDGSTDDTWENILFLNSINKRVKGVRLSRNFGHQYALFAGLLNAEGDAIICMDADLQHPAEIIPILVTEWEKGNKIVNTIRLEARNITYFKKLTSKLFYKIFSYLSGVKLKSGMADFRLIDRQVLENILRFQEGELFLRGITQWVGFSTSTIPFQCQERHSGKTKYTLRKMVKFATTGVTSFSIVPLRLGIIFGFITSGFAFIFMVQALYAKIILKTAVAGWATTIVVLSFMFGILFILVGVVGEYIGKILIEVKLRPRFIISDHVGLEHVFWDYRTDFRNIGPK